MATMRLYTTPSYTLRIPGIDISSKTIKVTFRQGDTVVTKTDATATYSSGETVISVSLTQAESGKFKDRPGIYCQVNWLDGGQRFATSITEIPPLTNLLSEVIS